MKGRAGMAAGNYKLTNYKGCPGMTMLRFGIDLIFTIVNVSIFCEEINLKYLHVGEDV